MPNPAPIYTIANKVRRALRKNTGCSLSYDQIVALTQAGLLDLLSKHEIEELMQPKSGPVDD